MADAYIPYSGPIVTRGSALAQGAKHYFTGKPCKRGHITYRYALDGACYRCTLEKTRRWQAANPEKVIASTTRWQGANPERVREVKSVRYYADPEKYRAISADWRERNPDKKRAWWQENKESYRLYAHRRRMACRASTDDYTVEQISTMLMSQGHKCPNCRGSLKRKYEIDHIMPLSLGGTNSIQNIQLLCMPCNRSKGAKRPEAWARENGRLL